MLHHPRASPFARRALFAALTISFNFAGCRNTVRSLPESPAASAALGVRACDCCWATAIDQEGLPNFHKVSDALYRGGQPTEAGLQRLAEMGVRTVVNVRKNHDSRACLSGLPMAYEHWPMSAFSFDDDDVVRFLQLVSDAQRTPVFLHCHYGADRTGMLCAMYRVVVQGWAKEDAIAEMTQGGMHFNSLYQNLVAYVENADAEALRRRAGLTGTQVQARSEPSSRAPHVQQSTMAGAREEAQQQSP